MNTISLDLLVHVLDLAIMSERGYHSRMKLFSRCSFVCKYWKHTLLNHYHIRNALSRYYNLNATSLSLDNLRLGRLFIVGKQRYKDRWNKYMMSYSNDKDSVVTLSYDGRTVIEPQHMLRVSDYLLSIDIKGLTIRYKSIDNIIMVHSNVWRFFEVSNGICVISPQTSQRNLTTLLIGDRKKEFWIPSRMICLYNRFIYQEDGHLMLRTCEDILNDRPAIVCDELLPQVFLMLYKSEARFKGPVLICESYIGAESFLIVDSQTLNPLWSHIGKVFGFTIGSFIIAEDTIFDLYTGKCLFKADKNITRIGYDESFANYVVEVDD